MLRAVVFDMDGTITKPVLDFETMRREIGAHLELAGSEVSGALVSGNQDAMLGALMNLSVNALEQGGEGVHLQVRLRKMPHKVVIEVEDDGPGISEVQQKKVFDPFFTTRSDGTGLGLAVVHSVVLGHQGEITLSSKTGQGTRFTLSFPLMERAAKAINSEVSMSRDVGRRTDEVRSIP